MNNNEINVYEKYKKLAIEATKFIDDNKNVDVITDELFIKAVGHLQTLCDSFSNLYSNVVPRDLDIYEHCHIFHTNTCNKIIKFVKRSEIFKGMNVNFWDWYLYIYRYNNDLAIIKYLLESASQNIEKSKKELATFIDNKKKGTINTLMLEIDIALPWILSTATYLRYCLEIIIFQLKNNNANKLPKLNLNNKIMFYDLLTKYERKNISFYFKDFSDVKEGSEFIKDFWTKDILSKVYYKLGEIIHFQSKRHINWGFNQYKEIKKYNDVEININYLTRVWNSIYVSIKNHTASFESSELVVEVENFYIDINKIFNFNKSQ